MLHIFNSDPDVLVVGTASDGEEALQAVERSKPDVVTMDIHMPKMDGFDATRRIMAQHPTPIVIVSGSPDTAEKLLAFRAIEAGALAILPRSVGPGHPEYEKNSAELVRTVKLMAEVKVVRRWNRNRNETAAPKRNHSSSDLIHKPNIAIVAIGASTGGPQVLQAIVSKLPADFPVPILVVQHIAAGFADGFVDWLAQSTHLPVKLAEQGELARPGTVYVAPDGVHLKAGPNGRLLLGHDLPENGLRPSVALLFRSVAEHYGPRTVAVLLSGMGKDGAAELKDLRERGATTIAQNRASSVVHGMPGEAIRLGAASYVLSPEEIAPTLVEVVRRSNSRERASNE
jgi:two-component system chemotaxis response regulator CheB